MGMAEKILIISPVDLYPGYSGNRERIRTICSELMDRGYVLDYFYTGYKPKIDREHELFFNGNILRHNYGNYKVRWSSNPLLRASEIFNGFKIKLHKWLRYMSDGPESAKFNRSLFQYRNAGKILLLRQQTKKKRYKAVIVNYAPYSFYFSYFNEQTLKIIDTHDKLTDRYKLYTGSNSSPADWHSLRYKDEKRSLAHADIIWAITEEERLHFSKMVEGSETQTYTLTHLIPYTDSGSNKSGKTIIMIGSENRLNLEGLEWFINQVWIKLRHYDEELQFLIAGSICNVLEGYVDDDRVHLLGLFDSAGEIYSKGKVFINPMQSGTGLKIKTFEALAHGKWVVSTNAGATGLESMIGKGLVCSDDPAEWIKKIAAYFKEPDRKEAELEEAKKMITKVYRKNLEVIEKSLDK